MMKSYNWVIILIFCTLIPAGLAASSANQPVSDANTQKEVTISDILEKAPEYLNQSITVTGTIASQCGSGCWFILSDKSGDLYVNLKPNNFVIPPAMRKEVTITGNITLKDNDVSLIGSSVLLEGKKYP
jgi:uncharacterized protein YdeI (BOF family)